MYFGGFSTQLHDDDPDTVHLAAGDLYIVRYKPIAPLLKSGRVALL